MLKKFVLSGVVACLLAGPGFAVTMNVEALSQFSTENPQSAITVKVLEDCELSDELTLHEGDVIYAKTTDIISPKRLKKNASFSVIPETYTDKNGVTHKFDEEFKGKYSNKIDKKGLAKSAAVSVGNYFVKGLSLGVSAVEGAVKNEEGNRFKSSAKSVYENSPLSYIETGEELNIQAGDIFCFKFKELDKEDEPNYNYTLPEDN